MWWGGGICDTRHETRGGFIYRMPVVYYDEEDSEIGDESSPSAIFLVCFELAVLMGMYYLMFFVPLSLAWF